MAASNPPNKQQQVDSSEKIAQQFLSSADDYFRSDIKCMFNSFFPRMIDRFFFFCLI